MPEKDLHLALLLKRRRQKAAHVWNTRTVVGK